MLKPSRKALAVTIVTATVVPMLSVMSTPASAAGVYFCYYKETITTVGTNVPYVVPASITTQPYDCPPGTIAQKLA